MLAVLKIKNLALVDDLTWELGPGLNSVTGQTGAGKSMIVGALKLILGERANHELLRRGEANCVVEACFNLSTNLPQINELLVDHGIDPCEENTLVVKRNFGNGNSQFVNCSACTLAVLKKLGPLLIDLHGPQDHQSLFSQERQLAMLDAYAQNTAELKAYALAHRSWKQAHQELADFEKAGSMSDREIELLRYQLEEISNVALIEEEMRELERRYTQARNAARLISASSHSLDALQTAVSALSEVRKHLNEVEKMDPDSAEFIGGFESARLEIEELEQNLREYTSDLEIDPAEMREMEHRIDQVEALKRKYGQTIGDVLAHAEQIKARLHRVENREAELARLLSEVTRTRGTVQQTGAALSEKRNRAIPGLEAEIISHLEGLGFLQSVFEVARQTFDDPQPTGFETIDFLFCPNPGEATKPLRVIASSGEMSRVMLAVKSALADQDETPLMVFDEIDANVGGEIAGAVGAKMAALGERHQVISITHMPQVAARAAHHFLVTKVVRADGTISKIVKIENAAREKEIARMLGGVGEETMALARKMLKS